MTTRSNRSNKQIIADETQDVTSSDHDDNVYPSLSAGAEEETESGAAHQQGRQTKTLRLRMDTPPSIYLVYLLHPIMMYVSIFKSV